MHKAEFLKWLRDQLVINAAQFPKRRRLCETMVMVSGPSGCGKSFAVASYLKQLRLSVDNATPVSVVKRQVASAARQDVVHGRWTALVLDDAAQLLRE